MRHPIGHPRVRVLRSPAMLAAVLATALTTVLTAEPSAAPAQPYGLTQGKVALVADGTQVHAFSATTGHWTSLDLTGSLHALAAGEVLGFALTDNSIAAFKSYGDHWVTSPYVGTPLGHDVEGATAVFWTTRDCYAISTVWTQWAEYGVPSGERVLGGGSAGSFGICWTSISALAYNGSTGQWCETLLRECPLGGIACSGIGLVWTGDAIHAFSTSANAWVSLQCGGLQGMSICGSGTVALAWGEDGAHAFSTEQEAWFSLEVNGPILAGQAGGETALLWTESEAFGFRAIPGEWEEVALQSPASGPAAGPPGTMAGLVCGPNPVPAGRLQLSLPRDGHWELALIDAAGRTVARRAHETSAGGREIAWTPVAGDGGQLPAGVYWLQARGAGSEEVRRITVLH